MVVKTETDRDQAKVVETETLTRLSLFSAEDLEEAINVNAVEDA